MANGLQNYPNIQAPDSDYPDGNIRDKGIAIAGTGVNALVYGDTHQTLAKLLRLSEITPNALPDNEYNGFQYIQALFNLFGNSRQIRFKDGAAASTIAEADYNTQVICLPTMQNGHTVSMYVPTASYNGRVFVVNNSDENVDLYDQPGTNNINGVAPPFVLGDHEFIELKYDSGTTDWVIQDWHKLDPVPF